MKTFKISVFKGASLVPILQETLTATSSADLKEKKQAFKNKCKTEHPSLMKNPKVWLGIKRINPKPNL